jgi:hypothetical protein
MAAPNSWNAGIVCDFDSGSTQAIGYPVVVTATERGVSFLGRPKVRFDSEVNLYGVALEPTSTALCQFGRLGDFVHPKQITVKGAGAIFFSHWHGELHVIDGCERMIHRFSYPKSLLPKAYLSANGFDQLCRVVTDAILEHGFDIFNVFNLL